MADADRGEVGAEVAGDGEVGRDVEGGECGGVGGNVLSMRAASRRTPWRPPVNGSTTFCSTHCATGIPSAPYVGGSPLRCCVAGGETAAP